MVDDHSLPALASKKKHIHTPVLQLDWRPGLFLWPSGSRLLLIYTVLVNYQFVLCQLLATYGPAATLKYVAGQHQGVSYHIQDSNADMRGEGGMVSDKAGSATEWQGAAGLL